MGSGADPDRDLLLIEGDGGCEHERTAHLGGDTGNNQYFYCEACEGVLVRAGEIDDATIRRQREQRRERGPARRDDPLAPAIDRLVPGGASGGRSWLRSKLRRLFE